MFIVVAVIGVLFKTVLEALMTETTFLDILLSRVFDKIGPVVS